MYKRLGAVTAIRPLLYDGVIIPFSKSAKNLGVIIDSNLSWLPHVNEVSKKLHFSLHSLKCLQNFLPLKTKISLVQTLLFPILDYADACYLDATEELLNKLERLQNVCIRFIFGLRKYDHISQFRSQLKWLPIRHRRNAHVLSTLYNILYNPSAPSYLRNLFHFSRAQDKPCRSNVRTSLAIPTHHSDFFSYSFTVHAARLWNALPYEVRDCPSLPVFKKRVKEHYLSLVV